MRVLAILAVLFSGTVNAAVITQVFSSSWAIEPWDYYGDVAAMQWQYQPYQPWDAALGTLQEVRVDTQYTGDRTTSEPLRIRYSFFSGWAPSDYQFYREFWLPAGSSFAESESYVFGPAQLGQWTTLGYYPPANYYFESRTVDGGHSISALTTLTFTYAQAVPEPPTGGLLLAAALAFSLVARARVAQPRAHLPNPRSAA